MPTGLPEDRGDSNRAEHGAQQSRATGFTEQQALRERAGFIRVASRLFYCPDGVSRARVSRTRHPFCHPTSAYTLSFAILMHPPTLISSPTS